MIDIIFDMETSDPDDVLTLCMLSHHPQVNLRAVTVTPGSRHQIGLVKHVLKLLNKDIPVGAKNINHPKECVSEFHYTWLGKIPPADADGNGADIMWQGYYSHPNPLKIVCGASLGNLWAYAQRYVMIPEVVIQGGFAGDNIVPPELVLEKFKGKITCPTFNLNGDVQAALNVLKSEKIIKRTFVSKNVCHGVVYDQAMHEYMLPRRNNNPGLNLMVEGMSAYLKKHSGKAFHDPLAACVAIDPSICQFETVELYREKGEWGSRRSETPNAEISIQVDMDKFRRIMVGE